MPKDTEPTEVKAEAQIDEEAIKELMPSLNMGVDNGNQDDGKALVSDEMLLGIYGEILEEVRNDRGQVDEVLSRFLDMVMNDGDSTTSSKEAVVNLLRIKTEQADKATKIADLMTRVRLKERDTFPRYLAAQQNNTINVGSGNTKRELLNLIKKEKKKSEDK